MSVSVLERTAPSATPGDVAAAPARARGGAARSFLGWLSQLVCWLVILGIAAVLAATVLLPRAVGGTPYTVLTGSMRPGMPPGSLVVVRPVDPADLTIGDVITFQLASGESAVATHRIIGVRQGVDGLEFITQGDANPVADPEPVREVQVKGERWYSLPYLGRVNNLLTGHQRQLAVYGVSGALVVYAGAMFAGAVRERRRSTGTTSTHREEDAR